MRPMPVVLAVFTVCISIPARAGIAPVSQDRFLAYYVYGDFLWDVGTNAAVGFSNLDTMRSDSIPGSAISISCSGDHHSSITPTSVDFTGSTMVHTFERDGTPLHSYGAYVQSNFDFVFDLTSTAQYRLTASLGHGVTGNGANMTTATSVLTFGPLMGASLLSATQGNFDQLFTLQPGTYQFHGNVSVSGLCSTGGGLPGPSFSSDGSASISMNFSQVPEPGSCVLVIAGVWRLLRRRDPLRPA